VLADETMLQLAPSDDGRWAIGGDDRAYRAQVDYDSSYSDYYLVDTDAGRRIKFCERCPAGFGSNPPVVWSPDGAVADNITRGLGRKQNIRFRAQRLEPDEEDEPRGIDPAKPVTLRAESLDNYDSGFWQTRLEGQAAPEKLVMAAKDFAFRGKAKEAGTSFGAMRKATDANPRRGEFLWGPGELIGFQNSDGVPLKAALFKPENFDPKKKYPLMVYIYERVCRAAPGHLDQQDHLRQQRLPGADARHRVYGGRARRKRAQVRAAGDSGGGG
jgi:hypothetical protein